MWPERMEGEFIGDELEEEKDEVKKKIIEDEKNKERRIE